MVTNFFVLNFLRAILVGEILDLLIKSQLFFILRHNNRSQSVSDLKLILKFAPTS